MKSVVTHATSFICGLLLGAYFLHEPLDRYWQGPTTADTDKQAPVPLPAASARQPSAVAPPEPPASHTEPGAALNGIATLIREGRLPEARELLDAFQDRDLYDTRAMYLSAQIHQQQGDEQAAIRELYRLLEFRPDGTLRQTTERLLARLISSQRKQLKENDDPARLLDFYQMLSTNAPERADYRFHTAEQLLSMGRHHEAILEAQQIEYDPNWGERATALRKQAQRQRKLANTYTTTIPLERVGEHYYAQALLNRRVVLRMLLDTGASISTISPAVASSNNLSLSAEKINLSTANGLIETPLLRNQQLSLGGLEIAQMNLSVVTLHDSIETDGLLGMDYLKHFEFFIDQQTARLHLKPRS